MFEFGRESRQRKRRGKKICVLFAILTVVFQANSEPFQAGNICCVLPSCLSKNTLGLVEVDSTRDPFIYINIYLC